MTVMTIQYEEGYEFMMQFDGSTAVHIEVDETFYSACVPNLQSFLFFGILHRKMEKVDHSLENIIYGEKIIVEVLLYVVYFKVIFNTNTHYDSYDVFHMVKKKFIVKALNLSIQDYVLCI